MPRRRSRVHPWASRPDGEKKLKKRPFWGRIVTDHPVGQPESRMGKLIGGARIYHSAHKRRRSDAGVATRESRRKEDRDRDETCRDSKGAIA
jgi:hypothetical protein